MDFLPLPEQCSLIRKWMRRSPRTDGRNVSVEALIDGEVILAFDGRISDKIDLNYFCLLGEIDLIRVSRGGRTLRIYPKDKRLSTSNGFIAWIDPDVFDPPEWDCDHAMRIGMTDQEFSDLLDSIWYDWLAG